MGAEVSINIFIFQCCKISTSTNQKTNEINEDSQKQKSFKNKKIFSINNIKLIERNELINNSILRSQNESGILSTHLNNENSMFVDKMKNNEILNKSKCLILDVISSNNEKISNIQIDPFGCIFSQRKFKDGITYFGYDKNISNDEENEELDVLIKPTEDVKNEQFYGRHFQIKFNVDDLNYYLKDLGKGLGAFVKIDEWMEIKNNSIINVGNNYMVFSINIENNEINIKIYNDNTKLDVYSFLPNKSPFKLGRSEDNEIYINDNMLSRVHCTVDCIEGKWYIIDGAVENDGCVKKSTNGSWLFAYDDILINDNTIFKANYNLFVCHLVDKSQIEI